MIMRFILLSTLLVASTHAETDFVLPACRYMTDETVPHYHTDAQCDRIARNSLQKRAQRAARHIALEKIGFSNIPDQLTVTCPEQPVHLAEGFGHDTTWIVENKSSGNVVIAYVKDGVEYSAVNPNITPPEADPDAILPVGNWNAVNTFEGKKYGDISAIPAGTQCTHLVAHFRTRFLRERTTRRRNNRKYPTSTQSWDCFLLESLPARARVRRYRTRH